MEKTFYIVIVEKAIDDLALADQNVKLIQSIIAFISENGIDALMNNAIDTILDSDLELAGDMLDNIKNSELFGAIEGDSYQGFYNSLIDSFMQNEYGDMIDFAVTKEDNFVWKDDLTKVKDLLICLISAY